jgi:hypothetical protein
VPHLPSLAGGRVYLRFTWGSAPPPLQWSFPHDSHCYKLSLLQACWVGVSTGAFSSLFIYSSHEGVPFPTLRSSGHPVLFATCLFFFFFSCSFIIQFGFFYFLFLWTGSVCPGGYADLSQGVLHATYLLTWWSAKQVKSWCLVTQKPSWFLCLMWCGDAMHGLGGVEVSEFCLFF